MATIKSFTSLEQSKKLAEILPLDSADMWWLYITAQGKHIAMMYEEPDPHYLARMESYGIKDAAIRCWSLAALLDILDFPSLTQNKEDEWEVCVFDHDNDNYIEKTASNPVDTCYEMILKLNELKML